MKYIILLEKCSTLEEFREVVPEHVAYMQQLHERGVLIAGGPCPDGKGGIIIIESEDEETAHKIASEDPFVVTGVTRFTLRCWEVHTPVRPELLTRDA